MNNYNDRRLHIRRSTTWTLGDLLQTCLKTPMHETIEHEIAEELMVPPLDSTSDTSFGSFLRLDLTSSWYNGYQGTKTVGLGWHWIDRYAPEFESRHHNHKFLPVKANLLLAVSYWVIELSRDECSHSWCTSTTSYTVCLAAEDNAVEQNVVKVHIWCFHTLKTYMRGWSISPWLKAVYNVSSRM